MRTLIVCLVTVVGLVPCALAEEGAYTGVWKTTNRRLDGAMTCVVKEIGPEKWQGRFHGIWQGVPFDYTVPFSGPPSNLQGTATIDGASYAWKGSIAPADSADPASPPAFKATFTGNRYLGAFDLVKKPAATPTTAASTKTSVLR